jgi:Pvc16 N-terminal domain
MANLFAIHSVGSSLAIFLKNTYPEILRSQHSCEFKLISSGELAQMEDSESTMLSLYLHRVTLNEHLRHEMQLNDTRYRAPPLSLDLHFLMTIWSQSALTEQLILAWAMRQLHLHQVLDLSALSPEAGWGAAEQVQVIPIDLNTEEIMRIWDALKPTYRLSVAYVARVVQIAADDVEQFHPVVATRFGVGDQLEVAR